MTEVATGPQRWGRPRIDAPAARKGGFLSLSGTHVSV